MTESSSHLSFTREANWHPERRRVRPKPLRWRASSGPLRITQVSSMLVSALFYALHFGVGRTDVCHTSVIIYV